MRKLCFILLLLISVTLISVSTIAASDVTDDVIGDVNLDHATADNVVVDDIDVNNLDVDDDVDDVDVISAPQDKKSTSSKKLSDSKPSSFLYLNHALKNNANVVLDEDYAYFCRTDSEFTNGILLDHDITIDGNGHTIDGCRLSRIFKIGSDNVNVVIKNLNLVNGRTRDIGGAAIFGNCTAINCTFQGNDVGYTGFGGAMYGGCAINCTFEGNNIDRERTIEGKGGAMYGGTAKGCIFKNNAAGKGGAVAYCNIENCILEDNKSGNWAGAMLEGYAKNCTFIRNYAPMSGGAMDAEGRNICIAEDCTFIENKANVGAAIADGTAIRCVFINNIAVEWGGSAIQWGNATQCTFNNDTVGDTKLLDS